MAKILYGVAGQGFGHSSRSHLIGNHLLSQGHDVQFAASMKSHAYLSQYFPGRVHEVFGLSLIYQDGQMAIAQTAGFNLAAARRGFAVNKRLFETLQRDYQPDLVISDYEPFVVRWARKHQIPILTVDHQNTLTGLELDPVPGAFFSRTTARLITNTYYFGTKHHIIINFFHAPVKSTHSVLANPVLRNEVIERTASDGGHCVFYTTDISLREKMISVFNTFEDETFFIYGYDRQEQAGNCIFKKTSTENFLEDLSSCRGVIATAGFSLISECLYFRKKMLLLPVLGQYEQMLNAHYMQKAGMGVSAKALSRESVSAFLEKLDLPCKDNGLILWPNNDRFFHVLDEKMSQLLKD